MDKIGELVTAEQVLVWVIIAVIVGWLVYKEWPEFKRRVSGSAVDAVKDAAADKSVCDRLTAIELDIKEIKQKLEHDYVRLNEIESWRRTMTKVAADSLEEREIIMQALLGVLGGLQEIGANGHTKEAAMKIRDYLNRKAHED